MKNYDEITSKLLSRRDAFVESKKKKTKIIVSVTLSCIVLISALSVGIVKGGVFKTTPNGESNITSNNSETSSQNKKVIYVTGEEPNDNIINDAAEGWVGSLSNYYLSPSLADKMDSYKDCTDTEVIYHVIGILSPSSKDFDDYNSFEKNNKSEELLHAEEKYNAAWSEYEKANNYLLSVLPNFNEPMTEEAIKALEDVQEKELIAKASYQEYDKIRFNFQNEYFQKIFNKRFEYISNFGKSAPIIADTQLVSKRIMYFFIDLTADELNFLTEKGEYKFALASSAKYIPKYE